MNKPSYQKISLDPSFPVKAIYMYSQKNRDLFYCHWHHNLEIIHVIQGSVLLYIDNIPYTLKKDDICIINPNKVHYGNAIDNVDTKVHLAVLSYDILPYSKKDIIYQKYLLPLKMGDLLLPTLFPKNKPLEITISDDNYNLCRNILLNLLNYSGHIFYGKEIAVQGAFLEFIAAMYHYQLLISSSDKNASLISSRNLAILDYVESHFNEPLDIPSIAKHFNLNEDYFYRLFKKCTGQTPITYINQLRIHYSKQLLRNTDMSISEISYKVGFNSPSYFTKIFKRYSSCSPTKYRKNYI